MDKALQQKSNKRKREDDDSVLTLNIITNKAKEINNK